MFVQQADTYLDGSPLQKKLASSTGAIVCCLSREFFLEFPLISVNSRKLFGAHGQGLSVVSPEEGAGF